MRSIVESRRSCIPHIARSLEISHRRIPCILLIIVSQNPHISHAYRLIPQRSIPDKTLSRREVYPTHRHIHTYVAILPHTTLSHTRPALSHGPPVSIPRHNISNRRPINQHLAQFGLIQVVLLVLRHHLLCHHRLMSISL